MKAAPFTSPLRARATRACLLVLVTAALPVFGQFQYQQPNGDEFYRRGNAFSEKVAGALRRVFGDGSPTPQPHQTRQQQNYTAPSYPQQNSVSSVQTPSRSPAPATRSRSYSAPSTTKNIVSNSGSSVPKPVTKTKQRSTASKVSSPRYSPPKKTEEYVSAPTSTESKSGVFTASKKTPDSLDLPPPPMTSTLETPPPSKPAQEELPPPVVKEEAPPPPAKEEPKPAPEPEKEAAKSDGTFPVGTLGKKPGRVVSPYPPHHELDARGLPSGSLALDPVTQKVFRVP